MANSFVFKDKTFTIGSTVSLTYKFIEKDKERRQIFKGIIIKVGGSSPATKMITIRKNSHIGLGIERIIPLVSPFLEDIKLIKKAAPKKAKLYYTRKLSEQQIRAKVK